jgi:AraC-like DNA-binding protein
MLVHVDLVVVFLVVCIVQGLTTAAYLLLARPRAAAARWLALWLLAVTLQVVDYALSRSGTYFRHHALYFMPLFFSWGFGPLLHSAVRASYPGTRPLGRWHFAPVAVQAACYAVLAVQPLSVKTAFWIGTHKPVTRWVEYYVAVVSVGAYVWASWRLVRAHGGAPRRPLGAGLAALGAFYAVAAVDPIVNPAYLPPSAPRFWLQSLLLPVAAYAVALWALFGRRATRPEAAPAATAPPPPMAAPAPTRRAPSVVTDGARVVAPDHLARVVHALERDALYRDAELTLDRLAAHVGLPANTVSQVINAGLHQSFSDVVNGYRLAEVRRRLADADAGGATLLTVALDAGFNSKTTFNRVFKERTGLTPREYREHCRRHGDAWQADGSRSTHRDDGTLQPG